MRVSLFSFLIVVLVVSAPFGVSAESWICDCGNANAKCNASAIAALKKAGATVLTVYPFGLLTFQADQDLNGAVKGVTIIPDNTKVINEQTITVEFDPEERRRMTSVGGIPTKMATVGSGNRRLGEVVPPPYSQVQGKMSMPRQ